ncbi:hypothetical protein ACLKA7_003887 [Drosophila subpalustris]
MRPVVIGPVSAPSPASCLPQSESNRVQVAPNGRFLTDEWAPSPSTSHNQSAGIAVAAAVAVHATDCGASLPQGIWLLPLLLPSFCNWRPQGIEFEGRTDALLSRASERGWQDGQDNVDSYWIGSQGLGATMDGLSIQRSTPSSK